MIAKVTPSTPSTFDDSLHTIRETCTALKIGPTTCWKLIGTGTLDAVRLGSRCTRVRKSSIDRVIEHGVSR